MNEDVPIGEVLPGIRIGELPDNGIPISALVLVKYLDPTEESTAWAIRSTGDLNDQETLGALIMESDRLRDHILEGWRPNE